MMRNEKKALNRAKTALFMGVKVGIVCSALGFAIALVSEGGWPSNAPIGSPAPGPGQIAVVQSDQNAGHGVLVNPEGELVDIPLDKAVEAVQQGGYRPATQAEVYEHTSGEHKRALLSGALYGGVLGAIAGAAIPAVAAVWFLFLTMLGQVSSAIKRSEDP